ncbi:MAG: flagellar export protein FliJ [Pseudooceanicola sp.]
MATDAARRRNRALSVMERVARLETEAKARDTAVLRDRMIALEGDRKSLLGRISSESQITGIEGASYLGRYIRAIRAEIERTDAGIKELRPDLDQAETILRAALLRQKSFEILKSQRLAEERRAARKRETAEMDEIGLRGWMQRR